MIEKKNDWPPSGAHNLMGSCHRKEISLRAGLGKRVSGREKTQSFSSSLHFRPRLPSHAKQSYHKSVHSLQASSQFQEVARGHASRSLACSLAVRFVRHKWRTRWQAIHRRESTERDSRVSSTARLRRETPNATFHGGQ